MQRSRPKFLRLASCQSQMSRLKRSQPRHLTIEGIEAFQGETRKGFCGSREIEEDFFISFICWHSFLFLSFFTERAGLMISFSSFLLTLFLFLSFHSLSLLFSSLSTLSFFILLSCFLLFIWLPHFCPFSSISLPVFLLLLLFLSVCVFLFLFLSLYLTR